MGCLKDQSVSESVENYLEALWISGERGQGLVRVRWLADHLKVSPPSIVQMLKKLERANYVVHASRKGVRLTEKGKRITRVIIRNHRLVEVMMEKVLQISIDHETVCGIKHHMDKEFADALCTLLRHPRKCPHGDPIPEGACCRRGSPRPGERKA